jgi:DNA-binding transcriptional regulator YiaG
MRTDKDQMVGGKQTSELHPGELNRRKLLAKLSEFVADSDLSIPRIAQLMGVSGRTLTAWISGTAKPQGNKLLEIRRFLDSHSPNVLTSVHKRDYNPDPIDL